MTTAHARGVIPVPTGPQRLMLAREYRSLTQSEMAEQLGVGLATVYRAESGKTTPRRTTIMAWAMATGVDLHWLETGEAPSPDGDGASIVRHQGLEPRTRWLEASAGQSAAVIEFRRAA